MTINAHEIKEFVKAQNKATPINEISTRKAAATKSKADIQKLNTEQWTSLKDSVKSETIKWKNSLVRNEWCNIGTYWKLDKFGLPRPIEKWNNRSGYKTEENSWKHSTSRNETWY